MGRGETFARVSETHGSENALVSDDSVKNEHIVMECNSSEHIRPYQLNDQNVHFVWRLQHTLPRMIMNYSALHHYNRSRWTVAGDRAHHGSGTSKYIYLSTIGCVVLYRVQGALATFERDNIRMRWNNLRKRPGDPGWPYWNSAGCGCGRRPETCSRQLSATLVHPRPSTPPLTIIFFIFPL